MPLHTPPIATAPPDAPPPACANCGAALPLPRPNFCPACGQETHIRPPRLGEFIQQFGGAYLATEGALWRTLKLLLFKPGELTRQYLAGRRKHYVLPLRLYLTISVIVLLALRAGTHIQFNGPEAEVPAPQPRNMVMNLGLGREAGLRDGVFFCEKLPQWVCGRLQRRLDVNPAQMRMEIEALGDRFISNMGGAMFLLLPTFALWLQIVYIGLRLRYTEHLVFALHVHAFWFGMLGLTLIDVPQLTAAAMVAVPVYTLLAMRRVYGGGWWARLLRAGVVSGLYGVVLAVALLGVGVWALLF